MSDTAATPAEETKTIEFVIDSDFANEILAMFAVPVPDAADLDEIRILIRDQWNFGTLAGSSASKTLAPTGEFV